MSVARHCHSEPIARNTTGFISIPFSHHIASENLPEPVRLAELEAICPCR